MAGEPEAGDIGWLDFNPIGGHEQAGRRPALVLTPEGYHRKSTLLVVCPITHGGRRKWPFLVPLPAGIRTQGSVMVDQIRALDRLSRNFQLIEKAPPTLLAEVRARLAALLQISGQQPSP
jgi:mRNA interferase MazF